MDSDIPCQTVLGSPPAWLESRFHFGIAIPAAQADQNRNRDTLTGELTPLAKLGACDMAE